MTDKFSKTDLQLYKHIAAERAVDFVNSGMVVGLGTGSTAAMAIELLGKRIITGELSDILGVPTSKESEREALRNGIPLTMLDDYPKIDLTIDGADEVDPDLNLVKGGGGALFREKIVAEASEELIIVVDESKLADILGEKCPIPVEVLPFATRPIAEFLKQMGAVVTTREDSEEKIFRTEQGNIILDCRFGLLKNPGELARKLSLRSGIIEHGLFINLATQVIVGGKNGLKHLKS